MSYYLFGSKKIENNNTNYDSDSGFQIDHFHDNIDINKRFSIVTLENDVNEYMNYRSKYYFYNNKLKKHFLIRRRTYKKKENQYYKLYINKMKYLEETYRITHNYTKYHAQLENLPSANVIYDGLNSNTNMNENGGDIFG
jgi:hypothetical protein